MPARCLNKAMLIGNLTRDPELRYTPSGSAVCSFGLATNRYWSTETGEKKEDVQFHRIVSWNKLAEICSQLLGKGDKVYLEGRLQTRQWTGADGVSRKTTEIVIVDMILLRSRRGREGEGVSGPVEEVEAPVKGALKVQAPDEEKVIEPAEKKKKKRKEEEGERADEGEGTAVAATDDAPPGDKEKKGKKEKKEKPVEKETEEGGEGEETVEIPEDKTPF